MNLSIATKDQLDIVRNLAYKIWPHAYQEILATEQLDYMLDKFYNIPALQSLQQDNNQVFILAHENGIYYGFAAYELNYNNSQKTKVHKIYVLPETQGKGIGKKLMDYIFTISISNQNTAVILNVNRYNAAINFYQKYGFAITETVNIDIGRGYLMEDYVMEKQLS